jgi:putative ABC transport system permease protein
VLGVAGSVLGIALGTRWRRSALRCWAATSAAATSPASRRAAVERRPQRWLRRARRGRRAGGRLAARAQAQRLPPAQALKGLGTADAALAPGSGARAWRCCCAGRAARAAAADRGHAAGRLPRRWPACWSGGIACVPGGRRRCCTTGSRRACAHRPAPLLASSARGTARERDDRGRGVVASLSLSVALTVMVASFRELGDFDWLDVRAARRPVPAHRQRTVAGRHAPASSRGCVRAAACPACAGRQRSACAICCSIRRGRRGAARAPVATPGSRLPLVGRACPPCPRRRRST